MIIMDKINHKRHKIHKPLCIDDCFKMFILFHQQKGVYIQQIYKYILI